MQVTIAPRDVPEAPHAGRCPTRADLATSSAAVLRRTRGPKADLVRIEVGGTAWMVKDFAAKPWWWRAFGRLAVRREIRAYERLEGLRDAIPRRVARLDRHALVVEWIDGELLALAPNRVTEGRKHVERLGAAIEGIHGCGVAHLDLRSNKNVILAPDGRVLVIDFASAVCFRPGSLSHRWIFPLLAANDLSGWLKWKRTLDAGPLTPGEQTLVRRHRIVRRLWLVNAKRRPAPPAARDSRGRKA